PKTVNGLTALYEFTNLVFLFTNSGKLNLDNWDHFGSLVVSKFCNLYSDEMLNRRIYLRLSPGSI
ncbi:MAG: hypothetical protein WD512_02150, partial [Candidatus Paceibacterota bacterium]